MQYFKLNKTSVFILIPRKVIDGVFKDIYLNLN